MMYDNSEHSTLANAMEKRWVQIPAIHPNKFVLLQ
jgi:hypothetical protein